MEIDNDRYNCKWVMWFAAKGVSTWAITINQRTYYSASKEVVDVDATWRAEEEIHKRQWREKGIFRFMISYLWKNLRFGYKKNKLEVDAKKEAKSGNGFDYTLR